MAQQEHNRRHQLNASSKITSQLGLKVAADDTAHDTIQTDALHYITKLNQMVHFTFNTPTPENNWFWLAGGCVANKASSPSLNDRASSYGIRVIIYFHPRRLGQIFNALHNRARLMSVLLLFFADLSVCVYMSANKLKEIAAQKCPARLRNSITLSPLLQSIT